MTTLGIDIGGSSIKATLLEGDRERWSAGSARYSRPDAAQLRSVLHALLASSPLASSPAGTRVGLCVPGLVDDAGERIIRSANMPGLIGVPLLALLTDSCPPGVSISGVRLCSDAHAAAADFAENRAISGRLLAISLGTGVGAAVLDAGTLVTLTGRSSGHFGQMDVTVPGIDPVPTGPDGGRGGLEAYIGLPALTARHGAPERWFASLRGDEPELAALARAIRIAHAIYRPDHIALLGGIGIRLAPVLPVLTHAIADGLTNLAREGWQLSCGDSDHHAARGAARLALTR